MKTLDELKLDQSKFERAMADSVFWMKRYYSLRGLINAVIMSCGADDYKTAQIGEMIKNEEYQDKIMFGDYNEKPACNKYDGSFGNLDIGNLNFDDNINAEDVI